MIHASATAGIQLPFAASVPVFSATTLFYRIMLVMRVFEDLAAQLRRAELWVPWIESGVRVLMTVIRRLVHHAHRRAPAPPLAQLRDLASWSGAAMVPTRNWRSAPPPSSLYSAW